MLKPVEAVNGFEIVGKLAWVGLDAEGNLNIILKKDDKRWTEIAVKALKQVEGHIIKLKVGRFRRKREKGEFVGNTCYGLG